MTRKHYWVWKGYSLGKMRSMQNTWTNRAPPPPSLPPLTSHYASPLHDIPFRLWLRISCFASIVSIPTKYSSTIAPLRSYKVYYCPVYFSVAQLIGNRKLLETRECYFFTQSHKSSTHVSCLGFGPGCTVTWYRTPGVGSIHQRKCLRLPSNHLISSPFFN